MPLFNDPTQRIITSASEPTNVSQGLFWNELDNNNNLIETWIRNNNKWYSIIKNEGTSHLGTAGTLFYQSLDPRYDYFLLQWIISLYTFKAMAVNDSLIVYLDRTPFSSILKSQSISGLAVNGTYNLTSILNLLISPSVSTSTIIRTLIIYTGNAPNYFAATSLKYQLVRK